MVCADHDASSFFSGENETIEIQSCMIEQLWLCLESHLKWRPEA